MIGYLKGTILTHLGAQTILLCQNVGYRVNVKPEILSKPSGATLELYIHHHSKDDGQTLYGFSEPEDLRFFELLLTVSGIGPKSALSILSSAHRDVLQKAIHETDANFFAKMGGIGKKTAEKIILELKSKLGQFAGATIGPGGSDVFDALVGLGYGVADIRNALQALPADLSTENQLKEALRILSRR